jgi:hypothetical protein
MNTVAIILTAVLVVVLLWGLYHRGNNKIKTTIHTIESVLNDNTMHINERIEGAKSICRNTKGIVFCGIYCALDAISRALRNKA